MVPFAVTCPGCGSRFAVRSPDVVGQVRACPKCLSPVVIPLPGGDPFPSQKRGVNAWLWGSFGSVALLLIVAVFAVARWGRPPDSSRPSKSLPMAQRPHPVPIEDQDAGQSADPRPPVLPTSASEPAPPDRSSSNSSVEEEESSTPQLVRRLPRKQTERRYNPELQDSDAERPVGSSTSLPTPEPEPSSSANESPERLPEPPPQPLPASDDPLEGWDAAVRERLLRPITRFEIERVALEDLVELLKEMAAGPIELDRVTLARERVPFDSPITIRLRDTTVLEILQKTAEQAAIDLAFHEDRVILTRNGSTNPPQ